MSQSSVIAAGLIIAFLVFVTVRGELPVYMSIFSGTAPAKSGTVPITGSGSAPVSGGASGNTPGPGAAIAKGNDNGFNYFDPSAPTDWDDLLCRMDPNCQYKY